MKSYIFFVILSNNYLKKKKEMKIVDKIPDIDNFTDSELDELIKDLKDKKKKEKKEEPEIIEKYLTAKEVAEILGIKVNTIYILARTGKIKCFKAGSVYFKRSDLDTYFHSLRSESKYENEAFCKKNCILSAYSDLMVFKVFSIYKITRENKIWIYLYNRQFEHSIRIGKKEFRKYFNKATQIEIDAGLFNLGPNFG